MSVILKAAVMGIVLGYLFLGRLLYGMVLFLPFAFFIGKGEKRKLINKRRKRLNEEFRDALCSMAAALEAGYSVESSLAEAEKDMVLMHGEKALIVSELKYMLRKIKNGGNIEDAFTDFAVRSGSEDAENFAEVFVTVKRSGGDLLRVINSITAAMQEKLEAKREIELLITSKKYEVNIMKYMPVAIILYLKLTSPEFIAPLYQGSGRLFMFVILPVWLALIYLSEKIMDINV